MGTLTGLVAELGLDTSAYDQGLEQATKSTEKFTNDAQSKLAALAGGGVLALGAAFGTVAGLAVDFAGQTNQSVNDLQASLGVTRADAEDLGSVVKDVFGNNFGDSIDDVTASVVEVRQQLGELTGSELQAVTEGALAIRDVFDKDVSESMNAVKALTEEFGITSEEALDFITKGFQNGLNSSDDFLDSIREYSNLMANNGFTAEEFFSVMETGLASGVLGTDKAADAFKEFGIKIMEVGDDLVGPDGALRGYLPDEEINRIFDGLNDGSVTVRDAFESLMPVLQGIENPIHQNSLGVALFGTMWEDMGAQAMLAIDTTSTSMAEMAGATDSLNAKYENLGAVGSAIWRSILLAIEPIGAKLLEIANVAVPYILAGIEKLGPAVAGAFEWLLANGGTVLPILMGIGAAVLAAVVPAFIAWAGAAATAGMATLVAIAPLLPPILAIGAVVAVVAAAWVNDWGGIQSKTAAVVDFIIAKFGDFMIGVNFVWSVVSTFVSNMITGFENIRSGTVNPMNTAKTLITGVWNAITTAIGNKVLEIWKTVTDKFNEITSFLGGLRDTMGAKALEIGQAIIAGIRNALANGASAIANKLKEMASSWIDGVKKTLGISSPSKEFIKVARAIVDGLLFTWRFAPEMQTALQEIMRQGLGNARETAIAELEKFNSAGAEAIRQIQDTFKKLRMDELTGNVGLQRSIIGARDTLEGLIPDNAFRKAYDRIQEINKLIQGGEGKTSELVAERSGLQAELRTLQDVRMIANKALEDQKTLEASVRKMAQSDPQGAKSFFDLRSKQIAELAKLEQDLASATQWREKEILKTKIAETKGLHDLELDLLEAEQTERANALEKEAIKFRELGENIGQTLADGLSEALLTVADSFRAIMPGGVTGASGTGGGLVINVDARGSNLTSAQIQAAVTTGVNAAMGKGYFRSLNS